MNIFTIKDSNSLMLKTRVSLKLAVA